MKARSKTTGENNAVKATVTYDADGESYTAYYDSYRKTIDEASLEDELVNGLVTNYRLKAKGSHMTRLIDMQKELKAAAPAESEGHVISLTGEAIRSFEKTSGQTAPEKGRDGYQGCLR